MAKTSSAPPASALKNTGERSFGEKFHSWLYDKRYYFLVFFLPAAITFAAYAVFGIYPFGEESVLVLDLNGQYVYYYELLRDAFWGDRSLIYSWSRNLSGELFGIYAYYLASPFMLIICLLPAELMCFSVLIMQLAKIGTAGVTFLFFLKKRGVKKPSSQVLFPMLYALMAYMAVQLMDPMWLDGLVYLPLIMWGVHRLVDERRILPLAVPLGLMFIAHFYIGYMIGFFTLLYFIYVCLSKEDRVLPENFITVCLKFFVGTVIAIASAAVVLIPVYNSLKLGKLEFTEPDFSVKTQFTFVQFLTKLYPLSYDTVYPSGLPMIYCGTLTLLLIPLFFLNSKINLKEKIAKGCLLLTLIGCMWISPVDMAWHGFQVPNWLPYRYSFVFSALLILMAARAYENLDGVTSKAVGGTFFGFMLLTVYLESQTYDHLKPFRKVLKDGEEVAVVQGIVIAILSALVCYILLTIIKAKKSRAAAVLLCGAVAAELFGNTLDTMVKNDIGVNPEREGYTGLSYSEYEGYTDYMQELKRAVDKVNESDNGFFRMEAAFHRTVNDAIGVGYRGLSHSSSTMNAPVLSMLKDLGYAYGGHYISYDGATILTDALFDIKYLMDRTDDEHRTQKFRPEEYSLKIPSSQTLSEIQVYENPYALSLGMTSDEQIRNLVLDDYDPFSNQNDLLNYICGDDFSVEYFKRIYPESTATENMVTSGSDRDNVRHAFEDRSVGECHIDYNFTMDSDSPLYMFLPTDYERKVNVWVSSSSNGEAGTLNSDFEYVGSFFEGDDYSIMEVGQFKAGDSVTVRVSLLTDDYESYWKDELFCTFDKAAFENTIEKLRARQWNITEFTDTYVEGTVTATQGKQLLFTTIPYEEGWTVKVDGKTVQPIKLLDSLIAVELPEGTHTVSMKFFPDYFKLGIIVSICGLLALVLVFMFEYKDGKIINRIISPQKPEEPDEKSKPQKPSQPAQTEKLDKPDNPEPEQKDQPKPPEQPKQSEQKVPEKSNPQRRIPQRRKKKKPHGAKGQNGQNGGAKPENN